MPRLGREEAQITCHARQLRWISVYQEERNVDSVSSFKKSSELKNIIVLYHHEVRPLNGGQFRQRWSRHATVF
jgi:hypothetical protein